MYKRRSRRRMMNRIELRIFFQREKARLFSDISRVDREVAQLCQVLMVKTNIRKRTF
jgi:hypothetical protein